jgi:glycine cleavage system aminomethyltransferase T
MTSRKIIAAAALVFAASIALTGCAGATKTTPTTTPSGPAANIQQVDASTLDGKTVSVAMNKVITLADLGNFSNNYQATPADPSIVTFSSYSPDGGKHFAPALIPNKQGTTKVVVTDKQGHKETITVVVTPAK